LTTLLVVVRPHVFRALRGEKLVLSNALGARYGMNLGSGTTSPAGGATSSFQLQQPADKGDPITIKKDTPIPESIEDRMLRLQDVLRVIVDKR